MISQLNTFLFGHLPFLSKQSSMLRINYTFRNLPFWHRYPAIKAASVEDSTDVLVFFCCCCYLPCHQKSDLFSNSLQVFSLAMIFNQSPDPFQLSQDQPIHSPSCLCTGFFLQSRPVLNSQSCLGLPSYRVQHLGSCVVFVSDFRRPPALLLFPTSVLIFLTSLRRNGFGRWEDGSTVDRNSLPSHGD